MGGSLVCIHIHAQISILSGRDATEGGKSLRRKSHHLTADLLDDADSLVAKYPVAMAHVLVCAANAAVRYADQDFVVLQVAVGDCFIL